MSLELSGPTAVLPTPSEVPGFDWTAAFTATLAETGGGSGSVYSVAAMVKEANGERLTADAQIAYIRVGPRARPLPPSGCLEIPVEIHYTLAGGARCVVVDLSVVVAGGDGCHHLVEQRFRVA